MSFRKIKQAQLAEFLEAKPWRYFDEIEELEDLDEEDYEAYESSDLIVVYSPRRVRHVVLALPKKTDFDLASLEQWILSRTEDFRLQINLGQREGGSLRFSEPYEITDPVLSLVAHTKPEPVSAEVEIRPLTSQDKTLAKQFPQERAGFNLNLAQLFSFVVEDELGTIYAAFQQDELIAYLATSIAEQGAVVIDDLYVLPEYRRQNIGTALSQRALAEAVDAKRACYWPVAHDNASIKTALKAGFKPVAQRLVVESL